MTNDERGRARKLTLFRPEITFHVDERHAELLVHLRLQLEKPSAQARLQARFHGDQLVRRRHGSDGAAAGTIASLHLPEPPEQPLDGLDVVGADVNRGERCSHGHRYRRHQFTVVRVVVRGVKNYVVPFIVHARVLRPCGERGIHLLRHWLGTLSDWRYCNRLPIGPTQTCHSNARALASTRIRDLVHGALVPL